MWPECGPECGGHVAKDVAGDVPRDLPEHVFSRVPGVSVAPSMPTAEAAVITPAGS